jgi:hypothetical protein
MPHGIPDDYGESVVTVDVRTRLRQCVLAVSVLADLDIMPDDRGVAILPRPTAAGTRAQTPPAVVTWEEVAEALAGNDPLSPAGRRRVTTLLALRRSALQQGDVATRLQQAARLLALPPGHVLHPGPEWARAQVPGGVLDLGVGLLGLADQPDAVQPLPPSAARPLDLPTTTWWPDLLDHVDRMGDLAARRIARDGRPVLRPVGGCDVLTLLASPSLRAALAGGDGSGLRAVAVPTRRRGWFDLAQVDPAYVAVAWSATSAPDRGVATPLLVTRDEVTAQPPDGHVVEQSLDEPPRTPLR